MTGQACSIYSVGASRKKLLSVLLPLCPPTLLSDLPAVCFPTGSRQQNWLSSDPSSCWLLWCPSLSLPLSSLCITPNPNPSCLLSGSRNRFSHLSPCRSLVFFIKMKALGTLGKPRKSLSLLRIEGQEGRGSGKASLQQVALLGDFCF